MKKCRAGLVFLWLILVIPTAGHTGSRDFGKNQQKGYFSIEHLYFGDEGIFFLRDAGDPLPINELFHDEDGYFIHASGSSVAANPGDWKCLYCNKWWKLGERCKNKNYPTNRWEKNHFDES